ncbi:hypothetical protein Vse01_28980 [Micromonospora sediminimaris]|uniref:Uncharacterized protein n=1 Tax=Micromonospora sediminimaris TaxID=547162 RepID=A0A9W5UV03_9ACTN|nr:hypothetical protein Vse01_28980 [Micromonospora sediminimaris]
MAMQRNAPECHRRLPTEAARGGWDRSLWPAAGYPEDDKAASSHWDEAA